MEKRKDNLRKEYFFKKVIYLLVPESIRICELTIKRQLK